MRLVEFEKYDIYGGQKVWVNPDQVQSVHVNEGWCVISFGDDSVSVSGRASVVIAKLATGED